MNMTRRELVGGLAAAGILPLGAKTVAPPWGTTEPEQKVSEKGWDFGGGKMYCFAGRSASQMLSTVFVSKNGHVAVVDGGWLCDGPFLLEKLIELGGKVDYWFITHAHNDHYGALSDMMTKEDRFRRLEIRQLVFSFPSLEWLMKSKEGSENMRKFHADFHNRLATVGKRIPRRRYVLGEKIEMDGIVFEVLNDCVTDFIDNDPINGTTICLGVNMGNRRILVTGDVSTEESEYLLKHADHAKFKADICFMTHHGQSGATKAFYEMVRPEAAIWPCPKWLWENDSGTGPGSGPWKTNYTKCWMQELGVKKNYPLLKDYVFC